MVFYLFRSLRIAEVKLVTVIRIPLDNLLETNILCSSRDEWNGEPKVDEENMYVNSNHCRHLYVRYEGSYPVWVPKSKTPNSSSAPVMPNNDLYTETPE